jgi:hypothetical protein
MLRTDLLQKMIFTQIMGYTDRNEPKLNSSDKLQCIHIKPNFTEVRSVISEAKHANWWTNSPLCALSAHEEQ